MQPCELEIAMLNQSVLGCSLIARVGVLLREGGDEGTYKTNERAYTTARRALDDGVHTQDHL
jgi:hypothetical protein